MEWDGPVPDFGIELSHSMFGWGNRSILVFWLVGGNQRGGMLMQVFFAVSNRYQQVGVWMGQIWIPIDTNMYSYIIPRIRIRLWIVRIRYEWISRFKYGMFHTDIEDLLLLEKYLYHLHPYQHATTLVLPLITFLFFLFILSVPYLLHMSLASPPLPPTPT